MDTHVKRKKATPEIDIGRETRLELYRQQLELRYCEKRAYDLFLQNLIKGTSHLSLGQEAIAAAFGVAMRPDDWTFCTYRGHAHTLARGASMAGMLGELMGRECGLLGGKGGSMHLTDVEKGAMGSYAIIGAHLPVAAGAGACHELHRRLVDLVRVVAVDDHTLEAVGGCTIGRRMLDRGHLADGRVFHVKVVLADEDHRKLPDRG